jgi:hypothetical protein
MPFAFEKLPIFVLKFTPQNTKTTPSATRIETAKMPFSLSWMVWSMCRPGRKKRGARLA